jgi:hypothetical protein
MAVNNVDHDLNQDKDVYNLTHKVENVNNANKVTQSLDNNEESGDDLPGMFVSVAKK